MTLLERIQQGVLLFDGAMGTQLQLLDISDEEWQGNQGCNELLSLTAPEKIQGIHENYFNAGSDMVETNTFGANRIVLQEYNLEDKAYEMNKASAEIARRAAEVYSKDKPRYVAGSIGPGTRLVTLGQTTYDELYDSYKEQAEGLVDGGVDAFIIETCQDLLQVKATVNACRDAMNEKKKKLPVIVSITIEQMGTMLVGSDIYAAITVLNTLEIDIMSLNCATGPSEMHQYIKEMSKGFQGTVMAFPNAGLPKNINGELVYDLSPEEFAETVAKFVTEDGAQIVGGCCGTTPDYIRELSKQLKGISPAKREPVHEASIASIYSNQTIAQDPPPLMVGERTNTNGSKLFRNHLLNGDWDSIINIAKNQEKDRAHALDLCVAYTGRDEVKDMKEAMTRLNRQITIPLVIDSTNEEVIEEALKLYAGKAVINSINLEDGEERAHRICQLAKRYGAALIALTIDEEGMAKTVEKKVEVAKRLYGIAVHKNGVKPSDLIFDPLTFTLGSGDETLKDAGIQTLEGIKQVKEACPGSFTLLGLSNISFGLKPDSRKILNSVYLAEAVKYGLDSAIVNVRHIIPLYKIDEEDKNMALDLIYNRGSDNPLFTYINHFDRKEGTLQDDETNEDEMPIDEVIKKRVIDGNKAGLEDKLKEKLSEISATDIINSLLIPAMKVVGELFGSGQMQLPFVLQSAEVMKYAVDILEPFIEKADQKVQKSIVLATVRGDVHDIGKNLVDIILTNNGYKVYNLGIKCEIETMLKKAEEVQADAIGMSGLLVKSTMIMKQNLEYMKELGKSYPILLGGAALTRSYVDETCDPILDSPVVYCEDAFSGLNVMNMLQDDNLDDYHKAEKEKFAAYKPKYNTVKPKPEDSAPVEYTAHIPEAPFLGKKIIKEIELDEVYPYLTEQVIFRGRWGYRRGSLTKEEYANLIKNEVRPEFERLKKMCKEDKLFVPQMTYGYYECNSDGNDVIIYDPEKGNEWKRFTFPRQNKAPQRCIADFFLPLSEGRRDIIAFQIATIGSKADEFSHNLYDENKYRDYLLFHGLSVETVEALAEYWHKKIREELNLLEEEGEGIDDFVVQKYRGSRYSFGYPACPDLEGNRLIHEIIDGDKIGVSITESGEMVPEQTTSAFIVHHPQAKYFTID